MDAAGQTGGTHGHVDDRDVDGVHCGHGIGNGRGTVKGGEGMYNPEEELRAIMDLLAEWRSKTGTGDVNMFILASGHGRAYNWDNNKATYEVGGYFGPQKNGPRRVEPSRVR